MEDQESDMNVKVELVDLLPSDDYLQPFRPTKDTDSDDSEEEEEEELGDGKVELVHIRRTIAEDLKWNLRTVPRLDELILLHFAHTYAEDPVDVDLLKPAQRTVVLKNLSVDLPLPLAAERIADDDYWKRRCAVVYTDPVEIAEFGGSWKRVFFERYAEKLIENFVPRLTDPQAFFDQIKIGGRFVIRLDVGQLLPPVKRIRNTTRLPTDESLLTEEELDDIPDSEYLFASDHAQIHRLVELLPALEELRITYGVERCGMNFDWNLFRFTITDCAWLTEFIAQCGTLKALTVHRSRVDDMRMLMLAKALTPHPVLCELRLPHNVLRDDGARVIARYVDGNEVIRVLDLQNNEIGSEGGLALGFCLRRNASLRTMNLRLNLIKDEGMRVFAKSLTVNQSLVELNLSCNGITRASTKSISELVENNWSLKNFDLSGNKLTQECGQELVRAMERNCSLVDLDLRLTDCGTQNLYCIGLYLAENKAKELKCHDRNGKASEYARTSRLLRYCLESKD